jgi:hypothetical protein
MSPVPTRMKWAKTGIEQRAYPRRPPSVIPHLKAVRIVAGPEAKLINISRGGALIETDARLAPKSLICLRIVTAEAILMLKGKVVYSRTAVLGSSTIRFHSAMQFDEEFLLADSQFADERTASESASTPGAAPPQAAEPSPEAQPVAATAEEPERLVMVTASSPDSGSELTDMFGLNNW